MATGPKLTTLNNGIRVITDTMPGLEAVSVKANFAVGSCYEDASEHGTAHFLEHMVFQGSAKRSAQQIQDEINDVGGIFNAWTDWDTTSFGIHILHEHMDTALDVLSDVVAEPRLDSDDVEKERGVILQELNGRNGSRSILTEGFYEAAFGDQSLARPIIGSEESIAEIDAKSLRSFQERHYTTGNLIVSIAGGIEHDRAVDLVQRKFAGIAVGNESPRPTAEYEGGEVGFACSCDMGLVLFGFSAPPIAERRGTAISIFRNILGVGPTSRLYRELREKRGLVYDASAYTNFHIRHPMMILEAEGHANKVKDLFFIMYDQLHEATANVTEEELEKAKSQMISSLRMERDYVCERSSEPVFDLTEIGTVRSLQEHMDVINGIDLPFMNACATRLVATTPTLAAHGPVRHLPKMSHLKTRSAAKQAA